MTTTTILHTTVAQEIVRIRRHMGHHDNEIETHLEAHHLAEQLTAAVTELLEHCHQLTLTESLN
jgi:hypothetical protein